METTTDALEASVDAVRSAVALLAPVLSAIRSLPDADLLRFQRELSELRREIDADSALVAGEVGFRSRRELGYSGLAQREGYRTPEALVRHETGSTTRDAVTLVRVGAMVHESLDPEPEGTASVPPVGGEPWLREVGSAVSIGLLSIGGAEAIRNGLGKPSALPIDPFVDKGAHADPSGVTAEDLAGAAHDLLLALAESPGVHADEMFLMARSLRDDLDQSGIAEREAAAYRDRSVRRTRRANGLSRFIIEPDIESSAFWDEVYDSLTSPRRGGARFVADEDKARADAIAADSRSLDQYLHDAFTQLLRIAVSSESSDARQIIGSKQPSVRVLITQNALDTRSGYGRIEGSDTPISIEAVERMACSSGTIPILFDGNLQPLDLGREQRLYSSRQRIAMAARDGGCMFEGCDRPPSWCEAHHVEHWKRDFGKTNISDGVLLCRHHHLLVHNNHWEIAHDQFGFWLIPPPDIDPNQLPRLMPSKSAALRDLGRLGVQGGS